jgi:hypothetical protein
MLPTTPMMYCEFAVNDVVFVLDPSLTISSAEFGRMLQFASDVVGAMYIDRELIR